MSDPNERRGALFKNDKGDNPKRPDYRGTCKLGGVVYGMAAWIAADRSGKNYLQIRFEVKPAAPLTQPAARDELVFDDDIPF